MFVVTADEKVQREQTERVHKFAEAMIDLVYWDSKALKAAYVRIEELEARIHELRTVKSGKATSRILFIASEPSSVPCKECGGQVIEYAISNPLWNKIVRPDGHEIEHEYYCVWCFLDKALSFIEAVQL